MWRKILLPWGQRTFRFFVGRPTLVTFLFFFLLGATNTFSELIHPLVKLPNCVLKQQPHILQFIRSTWHFRLSPSSRAGRLCVVLPLPLIFDPPLLIQHFTIYTTFHSEATPKNALELRNYSVKIRSQVQTITRGILPRKQSPSVSIS